MSLGSYRKGNMLTLGCARALAVFLGMFSEPPSHSLKFWAEPRREEEPLEFWGSVAHCLSLSSSVGPKAKDPG